MPSLRYMWTGDPEDVESPMPVVHRRDWWSSRYHPYSGQPEANGPHARFAGLSDDKDAEDLEHV